MIPDDVTPSYFLRIRRFGSSIFGGKIGVNNNRINIVFFQPLRVSNRVEHHGQFDGGFIFLLIGLLQQLKVFKGVIRYIG